ncbi:HNH endonuclease signature motif containing protein [Streptomyces sp. NPDC051909]|uniref:HNH endonuclease n=1 Tax=Streptomyces sp. NPDC051909 TaxID=3154944 RepID=UPI00341CBC8C
MNTARRRARKAQLAARDGWRCTYCWRRFRHLREATMDHVVPISLYRTWSANSLVLACEPCNKAKADRLFLSIALLLVWSTDLTFTGVRSTPEQPGEAFTAPDRSTPDDPIQLGPDQVDWLMLARLVQDRSQAEQLGSDQRERARPVDRRVRVGRIEHARRSARMNACEQSTDRGVSA